MKKIKIVLSKKTGLLLTSLVLLIWLALTNPNSDPPVLLLVPFALIFVLFYLLIDWLVRSITNSEKGGTRQSATTWLLSVLSGIAIVLSSLGQLGVKDLVTLMATAVVGLLYIFKMMNAANKPER